MVKKSIDGVSLTVHIHTALQNDYTTTQQKVFDLEYALQTQSAQLQSAQETMQNLNSSLGDTASTITGDGDETPEQPSVTGSPSQSLKKKLDELKDDWMVKKSELDNKNKENMELKAHMKNVSNQLMEAKTLVPIIVHLQSPSTNRILHHPYTINHLSSAS